MIWKRADRDKNNFPTFGHQDARLEALEAARGRHDDLLMQVVENTSKSCLFLTRIVELLEERVPIHRVVDNKPPEWRECDPELDHVKDD